MGQLIPEPVVQAGLAIQQCAFLSVEVVLQIVKGFNGVQRRQLPGGSTGCKQVIVGIDGLHIPAHFTVPADHTREP